MKTFINGFLPKLQDHGLDIFYLSQGNPDFFLSEYRSFWVDAIKGFRSIYSGALSNHVFSTGKYINKSLIDLSSIWDLLDGIGVWIKPYISNEPIYNVDEIVSGYFGSKLNGTSVVNELVSASSKFNKPVLVSIESPDVWRIGFITQTDVAEFGLKEHVAVYIPHSYAFSGVTYLVKEDRIRKLEGVSSADAMKFIVSGGVTAVAEHELKHGTKPIE